VVLFELLCGQRPYDVSKSGIYEAARVIRDQSPQRPTACNRALRGDLETIILKCLEKDPARRYQSVAELAGDIRRHLRREPIEARADSKVYVLRRNLYRHRRVVAMVVVSVAGVLAFAFTTTALWRRAELALHGSRVRLGRVWTREGTPLQASEILWREFLKRDSRQTRFALWEFYLKYPRAYANGEFGRQVDVEYSPSGKRLVTVTADGAVIVYDAKRGTGAVVESLAGITATVLGFSSNRPPRLYVGDAGGYVHVCSFDEESGHLGQPELRLPNGLIETVWQGPVSCLAFSECGRWLAVGRDITLIPGEDEPRYRDACISLWDLQAEGAAWDRDQIVEQSLASGIAFSPDASEITIAFASANERPPCSGIDIWSRDAPSQRRQSQRDGVSRRAAIYSADGARVYVAGGNLLQCDVTADAGELREVPCEYVSKWGVRSLAAGRDAAAGYLAFATGDGLIRFFDTTTQQLLPILGYHDCDSNHVAVTFSPNGQHVASVGPDGLSVWAFTPVRQIFAGPGHVELRGASERAARLLIHRQLAATNSAELELLENRTPVKQWSFQRYKAALSADGDWLAIASACVDPAASAENANTSTDEKSLPWCVCVFRSPDWSQVATLPDQLAASVTAAHWLDREGRVLLLGLANGSVAAWRVEQPGSSGFEPSVYKFKCGTECTRFAVDGSGRWLAACSQGGPGDTVGNTHVWHATGEVFGDSRFSQAYETVGAFPARPHTWCVALVRDGDGKLLVATTGKERDVRLWDATTGREAGKLIGHGDSVWYCCAIRDDLLATASNDGTVRIWDVPAREELCVVSRGETTTPSLVARGDVIAVCDAERITVLNLQDIDDLINANRPYEEERVRQLDERPNRAP
ncbi:MAG: hypothetical protein JXO22_13265, partial [Phycisphaerae bacterium]|nr:hypothetical protein [Phycisphaerae bacterium]